MNTIQIEDIKIGSKIKVRNAIFTITGRNERAFIGEQEHNGAVYSVTFPFSAFGNPHLIQMELA